MRSGIYKITNNVTGKFYIGSAKDIDYRWNVHRKNLIANRHCNPKLQHSWNFYGEDKFSLLILEEMEPDQTKLFEREQYYLDTFKPYIRGIGYNVGQTAEGGDNITHNPNRDAFIEKMSGVSMGENNPMWGQKHTEKTIKKQKEKAKGRYTLDWFVQRYGPQDGQKKFEDRRSMLINRKMNYSFPNPMKGKIRGPMSNDAKQKLTETKEKMKQMRPLILADIRSEKYTMKTISEKYGIGMTVVKYYKKKIKENKL